MYWTKGLFMAVNGKPKKIDYSSWSQDELIKEIKKLNKRKKYGLVWDEERIKEIFEQEAEKKLPVLKEIVKNGIKNQSKSNNILIEGDNYHALSVLNYTHKGKIDVIYIDPPYNTGNNTWKYNNRYIQDDDSYKHSKWISFMTKRLQRTKRLLKKNGVICVTIDNHELHNLRHMMGDVFPDKEIIVTVIEHNIRGRTRNNFALTHEYALWAVNEGDDLITKSSDMGDDIRRNLRRTGNNSRRADSPTMFYGIEVDKKSLRIISVTKPLLLKEKIPNHSNTNTEMIWPIDSDGNERNWYYSPKTMLSELKKGELYAKKIKNTIQIHYHITGKLKRRKSVWSDSIYDASTYGSELLTEIIGENNFPFPKSIHTVKECIRAMTNKKDAVILDFFAGSGTTGHAVLELNKEDGGDRRFILCTNNEGNICNEITLPRLLNVINGYSFTGKQRETLLEKKLSYAVIKKGEEIYAEIEQIKLEQKSNFTKFEVKIKKETIRLIGIKEIKGKKSGLDGNLKYFTTFFVDSEPTDQNKKIMVEQSTEMLCLKEDCFELVKKGNQFKIFKNHNDQYLGIIYYYDGIEPFQKEILKIGKKINTYVFSFTDEINEDEFEQVRSLITLKPIPSAILNIYRQMFPYVQTKKLPRQTRK